MKIGIVSGYFNPIHGGHIDYIVEAKKHCDYLVAIVNNDRQAYLKYQSSNAFMTQEHRKKIVSSLRDVDETVVCKDADPTVCGTLIWIRGQYPSNEMVFFNSGDRPNPHMMEAGVCARANISTMFLPLDKIYSSRNYRK